MSHLIQPRRFGRVFQIDGNLHGTLAQQQALRDALSPAWGTRFDALLYAFDVYFNRTYLRSYVNLEIKDFGPDAVRLAIGGATAIAFSDRLHPTAMKDLARHEFGHVLDESNFITQTDRDWFAAQTGGTFQKETWADAVRDWINGTAWRSLDAVLLKPVPVPPVSEEWVRQVAPSAWGARVDYDTKLWRPWNPDKLVVHYEGPTGLGDVTISREMSRLRAHEEYHIDVKGWLGLAYNYAIGNTGTLYRVRGENRSGATSGDQEPDGIPENYEARAYLFLIGGEQQPSAAAKFTFHREWVRWGKPRVTVHSDSTSTSCPGVPLRTWVRSGGYRSVG